MTFAGFDTSEFPGVEVMQDLKAASNLTFTGYYLAPAPSHADTGWMGQREALAAQGWGFSPIYVGQEIVGPGSKKTSASQGKIDGADAAKLMEAEGFPKGTVCYLDLENGDPFPQEQQDYVSAWCAALNAGGYAEGVYCSYRIADAVHRAVPYARIWAFRVQTVDKHPIQGPPYPTPVPASCGFSDAYMWQREQNGTITFPGKDGEVHKLLVDLSTSIFPDPSKP